MNELNDCKSVDGVVNRHIARILTELEDASCPAIFRNAVKSNLQWLRSDLKELLGEERHEPGNTRPRLD